MKNQQKIKQEKKDRRHRRVRAKIKSAIEKPRLSVFRSNKQIYVQLINDEKGCTLMAADSQEIVKMQNAKLTPLNSCKANLTGQETQKKEKDELSKKIAIAYEVGKLIAKKAIEKKIEKVVFDRGGYKYHGRVKAVADGAREGGLKF
ncbi:MAG: 50S ribosomal protein L18 [Candidatus Kuenenbacteria bacterium]